MLFHSTVFLCVFLPSVLAAFLLARRFGGLNACLAVLLLGSLVFYGYWDPVYLPLLAGSIAGNYAVGQVVVWLRRRALLGIGIAANLAVLGFFKYRLFFAESANAAFGLEFGIEHIVLPLAISFFTFQQISYLVDVWRGDVKPGRPLLYAAYVAFFPQLIAGPIVRFREVSWQFSRIHTQPLARDLQIGFLIFFAGLVKKTVFADGVGDLADTVFRDAGLGIAPDLLIAWLGALAFGLQIYFDFSGYTDMATGLARMFGIRLPMNFNSPYQAIGIVDFWRRWHMTLSRFLRDYLYIPLGGNRRGFARGLANVLITMLLGGLWHGAGWTFVVWGGLHGGYICLARLWGRARLALGWTASPGRLGKLATWAVTLMAVTVAWVFFRAPDFATAWTLVAGMFGAHGVVVPSAIAERIGPAADLLAALGVTVGASGGLLLTQLVITVIPLLAFCALAPNSAALVDAFDTERIGTRYARVLRPADWPSTAGFGAAIGAMAFGALLLVYAEPVEFIYFNF